MSGSRDKTIRVWEINNGIQIEELKGHLNEINSIDISRDKKFIVSGGNDIVIRVWNRDN